MVNLFLYYNENKWLLDTKKQTNLRKARLFSNTFRFTGNLCATNDHLEFDRNLKNIYPSVLLLKKENISTSKASVLDLSIIVEYKKFKTQLYDKRDASPFSIVRMPHLDSNIPSNIYYVFIDSESLRFPRTTLDINTFVIISNRLLELMQKQEKNIDP